jgi:hypothetical protein
VRTFVKLFVAAAIAAAAQPYSFVLHGVSLDWSV